ncbi:VWA domain-containing protein [Candidatus Margulisiibacteriota bacterium]
MRFANLEYFWLLFLVPVLGLIIYFGHLHKLRLLKRFISGPLLKQMLPNLSYVRKTWKKIIFILALVFIIIAILRPQFGTRFEKISRKGQDILIALDVSQSMLAEDIKPSRIKRAKQEIRALISSLKEDRIGLIVFAGNAAIQCPLTLDYAVINLFLDDISVGQIAKNGSNISAAIKKALTVFNPKEKGAKSLIIFTDGEYFGHNPQEYAQKAKADGINIFTVGIGLKDGEPLPIKDEKGNLIKYKKDQKNNLVLSKLNDEILKSIAMKTDGRYFFSSKNNFAHSAIYKNLLKQEKKAMEELTLKSHIDRYHFFLFIAFLLLMFELLIPEVRKKT